ncbi:MAG: hypothetical protein ACREPQ_14290 [Rhodanobacter sp.]
MNGVATNEACEQEAREVAVCWPLKKGGDRGYTLVRTHAQGARESTLCGIATDGSWNFDVHDDAFGTGVTCKRCIATAASRVRSRPQPSIEKVVREVFSDHGDFAAARKAEAWCKQRGIAVGRMDRFDMRGLLVGNYDIAKWHNLSKVEVSQLHGVMSGDMRNGPVAIRLSLTAERADAIARNLSSTTGSKPDQLGRPS